MNIIWCICCLAISYNRAFTDVVGFESIHLPLEVVELTADRSRRFEQLAENECQNIGHMILSRSLGHKSIEQNPWRTEKYALYDFRHIIRLHFDGINYVRFYPFVLC